MSQTQVHNLDLNPDVSTITLDDQLRAIGRELGLRRAKYPQWVKRGQISQQTAQHELACLSAVYKTLKDLKHSQQDSLAPPKSSTPLLAPV